MTLTASAVTSFPMPSPGMIASFMSHGLDRERHPHASRYTQRREAALRLPADHFIQQCDDDAGAGAANRVAERDGPAVDVQLVHRNRQVLENGEHLRGERFV